MPPTTESFKVFFSHSEADAALTEQISNLLEMLGIHPFVYEYYSAGGINRFDRIKTMIQEAPLFLVLLTDNGLKSQWVNQEIGYAVALNKTPIPILEINPTTKERLTSRGFIELHDPILLDPSNESLFMGKLVYTMHLWLLPLGMWQDKITLTCSNGHTRSYDLDYEKMMSKKAVYWRWQCPYCANYIKMQMSNFKILQT